MPEKNRQLYKKRNLLSAGEALSRLCETPPLIELDHLCITARRKNIWVPSYLPPPPPTPIQSARFYFRGFGGVSLLKPQVSSALRCRPRPPAERRGQREPRGAGPQRQPRTGPKRRALNDASQTQRGCTDFRPIFISQETNKDREKKKIIQIKTGNNRPSGPISTR